MPEFLDTSVVVRYLTDDPPAMAERAERLIESSTVLFVTDVVIGETAYVLRDIYRMSRIQVVDLLVDFLRRENIQVHLLAKDTVIGALLRCRPSGRVSISDALIWAAARCAGSSVVYSFDRRFP